MSCTCSVKIWYPWRCANGGRRECCRMRGRGASNLGELERLASPEVENSTVNRVMMEQSQREYDPEIRIDVPAVLTGTIVFVIMLGIGFERIFNFSGLLKRIRENRKERKDIQERINIMKARESLETSWRDEDEDSNNETKT